MKTEKKVLVIGAGVAGLTAIKACKEENVNVKCYERTDRLGGLWCYREKDRDYVHSVFKNTISNSSKELLAFSDFPPPSDYPTYLHNTLVLNYFQMYAEHFHLLDSIIYSQEVLEVRPDENYSSNGRWIVKVLDLSSEEIREETYDGVMVCIGHHKYPIIPPYPYMNIFAGKIMHSRSYDTCDDLKDKTVVVVGAGSSGADIASEISNTTKKVYLSTRRGAWIYPRMSIRGKPYDIAFNRRYRHKLPSFYLAKDLEKTLNLRMDHERFGIKPSHSVLSQHPTVNDEIQAKLLFGAIQAKRDIKKFTQNGVLFEEDSEVTSVDVVIFATGYKIQFPFLNDYIVKVGEDNRILLYENMFSPQLKHPSLGIIGLIQPSASLHPVFEMQSRYFVALMAGRCNFPSPEQLMSSVERAEELRSRNFVPSARHSINVAWITYMDNLAKKFGAKPNLTRLFFTDPKLFFACYYGPCLPYQYRLNGPHKWEGAREAILNYKTRLYQHLTIGKKT